MKINKRIVIVRSTIGGLRCMSKKSCQAIHDVLSTKYSDVSMAIVDSIGDLEKLAITKPDLVFLGVNSVIDESGNRIWLENFLDSLGISCTGSSHLVRKLGLNKPLAKQIIIGAGLNTPKYIVINKNSDEIIDYSSLNFPVFIKPINRGGGQGIDNRSIATNQAQLRKQVQAIAENWNSSSIVEEFLPGREFSVAVIKNVAGDGYTAMPIELIALSKSQGQNIMSKKMKNSNGDIAVKVNNEIVLRSVKKLAIDCFISLEGRDYGVIDIRLDKFDEPSFLEANFTPSLIDSIGNFPRACFLDQNIKYPEMINRIVELGLSR